MSKQHIHIGVEESGRSYERFIDAWRRAETGDIAEAEVHLNFEDLSALLSTLSPRRLAVLRTLRQEGPLSIRALAGRLERDYKNVHADVRALEQVDLLIRTEEAQVMVPWDVIDAHLNLAA